LISTEQFLLKKKNGVLIMAEGVIHITDENFEQEVMNSDIPVFVDFWATWCAPCKRIGPFVEELAVEFAGKAKVVKVDVEKAGTVAAKFGVTSVPTLLVIKDGQPVESEIGALPKDRMAAMLSKHI
jgi:thioredoxin